MSQVGHVRWLYYIAINYYKLDLRGVLQHSEHYPKYTPGQSSLVNYYKSIIIVVFTVTSQKKSCMLMREHTQTVMNKSDLQLLFMISFHHLFFCLIAMATKANEYQSHK